MTIQRVITNQPQLPPLSIRQDKLLKGYLSGMSATEAYRQAGYTAKHADRAAHMLITNPPLSTHLDYFREQSKQIVTKDDKTRLLREIAEDSAIQADTRIKAIAELNKMQGDYMPIEQKVVNVSIKGTLEDIRQARLEYKQDK